MMNRRYPVLLAVACSLAAMVSRSGASPRPDADMPWVGSWTAAPQLVEKRNLPPAPGLSGNTLRQEVHLSTGGARIRFRFSNEYGNGPLAIESAHVAVSEGGGKVRPDTDRPITFSGRGSVTIPHGAPILSDPLPMEVVPMAELAVTIHYGATPSDVTGHPGSRATSYLQEGDAVPAAELPAPVKFEHWYTLSGIDVAGGPSAAAAPAAVVILGDSVTDGRGSGTDRNDRWPDDFERRLAASGSAAAASIGVLNQGLGGNALLHGGLGPTALARFDRDVAAQAAARWLIVLEGVNDIGGAKDDPQDLADHLVAGYQQIVARVHALRLRVYGATILPFEGSGYFSPEHEAARQKVNDWIRTGGQFDAVIDFDAATRDPRNPSRLLADYDCGDHLHPNEAGYRRMADAIDLKLFER